MLHYYNTTLLGHYNATLLKYYATTILQCYNTAILHYYTTTMLHYYNTALLQCYTTTILQCYTTTLLQYHATTILRYYTHILLQYYTTAILHYYNTTLIHYYNTTLIQYHTTTLIQYYNTPALVLHSIMYVLHCIRALGTTQVQLALHKCTWHYTSALGTTQVHLALHKCTTELYVRRLDFSWNVMAHGDTREGKWRGNCLMQWVASTLHTTSEHGVPSITTADAHTSAASIRLNWRPPADLNGLVRFAGRRNLVSASVPSHFNWPLLLQTLQITTEWSNIHRVAEWWRNEPRTALNSEVRHPRCVGTITQRFCVLHIQSNRTVFHLAVQ